MADVVVINPVSGRASGSWRGKLDTGADLTVIPLTLVSQLALSSAWPHSGGRLRWRIIGATRLLCATDVARPSPGHGALHCRRTAQCFGRAKCPESLCHNPGWKTSAVRIEAGLSGWAKVLRHRASGIAGHMHARCSFGKLLRKLRRKDTRERIQGQLKRAANPRQTHRLAALHAVASGCGLTKAARLGGCSRASLYRWCRRHASGSGLMDRPRRGRPRKGSGLGKSYWGRLLKRSPMKYGYQATVWTAALLKTRARKDGKGQVSERTLRRRLHEAGFRWKRPRYFYHKRAPNVGQKKGPSRGGSSGCLPTRSRS